MVKNNKGFTLAETLMVVTILGIVVSVAPKLMVNGIRLYQLHAAKLEIQRDARVGLELVNRFLRQAQGYTVVIDQATGQPPYSRITFRTIGGDNMRFYQHGNQLYHVGQSTVSIAGNLRYIAFTYPRTDDPTIISVAVTMEKATFQGATKALELSIEKVRIMN